MARQDDYIKTALRLPRELHKLVQDSADDRGRSMNAEIIERLQRSFESMHASTAAAEEIIGSSVGAALEIFRGKTHIHDEPARRALQLVMSLLANEESAPSAQSPTGQAFQVIDEEAQKREQELERRNAALRSLALRAGRPSRPTRTSLRKGRKKKP
ncbi:Arc family DNA-binding protein [Azoarcus indigens]|uniref:Arc family DNA-binding protein n=1 Tax=Azoarcus indigens TaxID=29545 RepID=UPI00105D01C5|nr:Arc family DNA-binding protein [Azoarcus indigens]NMG64391.1 Arc family DNA-binding protein [Azoarcus indigens]